MSVSVGDRVQIVNGGVDVTNGNKATAGRKYGEGGPLWCTVVAIDTSWNTGGKYGLPKIVTKVRCAADDGTIVWQVQPEHVTGGIKASEPETVQTEPEVVPVNKKTWDPVDNITVNSFESNEKKTYSDLEAVVTTAAYVPGNIHNDWKDGYTAGNQTTGVLPDTLSIITQEGSVSPFEHLPRGEYQDQSGGWRKLNKNELKNIGSNSIEIDMHFHIHHVQYKQLQQMMEDQIYHLLLDMIIK